MTAIILAALLAFLLQLAIWEGVVLGAAWLVGKLADISVNYPLIGGIVFGVWAAAFVIRILIVIGTHRIGKEIEKDFDKWEL